MAAQRLYCPYCGWRLLFVEKVVELAIECPRCGQFVQFRRHSEPGLVKKSGVRLRPPVIVLFADEVTAA